MLHLSRHVAHAHGYQPRTFNGFERKISESWQRDMSAVLGTAYRWLHQCIADTEAERERKLPVSETLRLLDGVEQVVKDNGKRRTSAFNVVDELRSLMQEAGLVVA